MNDTVNYYNKNAKQFTCTTSNVNIEPNQIRFLNKIPQKAHILDFGCGSGRDTKYFLDKGYFVTAVDGSQELCDLASEFTGINVKQMMFQDIGEQRIYDAIWACASILHLSKDELIVVLIKMCEALTKDGIIYTSFKYGEFEGDRNGRYFTDMTEDSAGKLLDVVVGLTIEEQWVSQDVRVGREDERWLNLILRKI